MPDPPMTRLALALERVVLRTAMHLLALSAHLRRFARYWRNRARHR